ncbi:MAG: hypothetical protein JW969_14445 [Spirochaetales bacterium]|nr:hypothetical protein [Spirochaetales bacterium]
MFQGKKTKTIPLGGIILSAALVIITGCSLPLPGIGQAGLEKNAETSKSIPGFPVYKYIKTVLPSNIRYNPTGEFIFPCVIDASLHLSAPLARYYLYYAPHNAPGGICLAYANNIEGPYTEYPGNPIVSRNWPGKYSVSHVSAAQVVWLPQYNKYLMYFHGENTTVRWAYSTNGVNWGYGGVALTASQFGSGYTECSYQKVFEHTIPGKSNRYVMFTMLLIGTGDGRKIGVSISNDGKKFTPYDPNLVRPEGDGDTNLSGPSFYRFSGGFNVIYHGSKGNIYLTEVGSDFSRENHRGVFHAPLAGAPDYGRSAAPFLITADSVRYMFYEAGGRGITTIALARGN